MPPRTRTANVLATVVRLDWGVRVECGPVARFQHLAPLLHMHEDTEPCHRAYGQCPVLLSCFIRGTEVFIRTKMGGSLDHGSVPVLGFGFQGENRSAASNPRVPGISNSGPSLPQRDAPLQFLHARVIYDRQYTNNLRRNSQRSCGGVVLAPLPQSRPTGNLSSFWHQFAYEPMQDCSPGPCQALSRKMIDCASVGAGNRCVRLPLNVNGYCVYLTQLPFGEDLPQSSLRRTTSLSLARSVSDTATTGKWWGDAVYPYTAKVSHVFSSHVCRIWPLSLSLRL